MTDPVDRPDLVPPNDDRPVTTALVAVDGRIDDANMLGITTLKEVDETDDGFLPFLGYEDSVDVWDPAWPDATKRAVIEAAPIVHRHKGTVYAVKTALTALSVDAIITEWWQTIPRRAPYTFSVRALVRAKLYNGPLLDPRTVKVVFDSIVSAKPESRAFDLTVAANAAASLGLAPVILPRFRVALAAVPVLPPGVIY